MSTSLHSRIERLLAADPELLADPFPTWNELRTEAPVLRLGDAVLLSRHADVKELLGDNNVLYGRAATKTSRRYRRAQESFSAHGRAAYGRVLDQEFNQIVRMDPPDHPRVRAVVMPPFSARNLAREMESLVRTRVSENLDRLAKSGGAVDFKRFAYTLPLEVLGDLLGIPLNDLDKVHSWAYRIAENKMNADSEHDAIEADGAYQELMSYIEDLIGTQRRSGATTGLVAALLASEDEGRVSHEEAMSMIALMIFAGHETTSNLLSIGLLELLNHRDQWLELCNDPTLVPTAIEELLRFVTPVNFLQYVATQTRELPGGTIEAGDTVIGVLAAANRDPDIFADPNVLDIRRKNSRMHVSLGLGPHFCLGAGLARMEAVVLFEQLTRRFPEMELAGAPDGWGGRSLRTPLTMPVLLAP